MSGHIARVLGSVPTFPVAKAAQPKGLGVVGLHEGPTLLAATNRCAHERAFAGRDLDAEEVESGRTELPELV